MLSRTCVSRSKLAISNSTRDVYGTAILTIANRLPTPTMCVLLHIEAVYGDDWLEVNESLAYTSDLARSQWTQTWPVHVPPAEKTNAAHHYGFDSDSSTTLHGYHLSTDEPWFSIFGLPNHATLVNIMKLEEPGTRLSTG